MSVDLLQEKIRKVKNPSMVKLSLEENLVPPSVLEAEGSLVGGYSRFCRELLQGLKDVVPAVRFRMGSFVLHGPQGLQAMQQLMEYAKELGYYVVMDAPELLSDSAAKAAAKAWPEQFCSDGLVVSPWLGSDVLKPFVPVCKEGKSVFAVVRTANKTAPELQDLLTGSRLVHSAAAEIVNRQAETLPGKSGYDRMGALVAATAANTVKTLRSKFPRMFLMVDGYDYSGANAKNCGYAFDKYGHGAVVCAGSSVTGAWREAENGEDYVEAARQAVLRMKKNITRYVTVL